MTTADERELLDEELHREVAAALMAALAEQPRSMEAAAIDVVAELRKRRIVLYRRAVHTLPAGLHQTTIEELAADPALARGSAARVGSDPGDDSPPASLAQVAPGSDRASS